LPATGQRRGPGARKLLGFGSKEPPPPPASREGAHVFDAQGFRHRVADIEIREVITFWPGVAGNRAFRIADSIRPKLGCVVAAPISVDLAFHQMQIAHLIRRAVIAPFARRPGRRVISWLCPFRISRHPHAADLRRPPKRAVTGIIGLTGAAMVIGIDATGVAGANRLT